MLILQVLQGPDRGRRFELPEHEPQLIGRSTEALPITDPTVSRRHAELTPDRGGWWVRDLDSANGTFVNGRRIAERVRLAPGDQVRCGSTLLLFGAPRMVDAAPTDVDIATDADMDVTLEHRASGPPSAALADSSDPALVASEHLRVIYELTRLTSSATTRDELFKRVLNLVVAEFRPDRAFILLGDRADSPLTVAGARYRTHPRSVDEGRLPVSRTIIRHALELGEGVLSTNAMSDTRFAAGDSVRDYGIRSALCVPIATGRRTFGVIHIDSQLADVTFTESQLHLLRAIGRYAGLALLSIDLFDERLQNERLAAIGQTVASLSHSIKNILQGLRGGADAVELALARDDLALAREGWPILARNLDRILNLTLNMLAWSRPTSLDIELSDLNSLVREATDLVARPCEEARIALVTDFDDGMPPVPIDAGGIHQAIVNLLMNAMEAVPPRRGTIGVSTRFDPERLEARIRIGDNGPGIPEPMRAGLFEAFRTSKGQRGTGLGLAVTRKIVEEHGGRVEIESEPGRGTDVSIVLPTARAPVDPGDTHQPRPLTDEEIEQRFGGVHGPDA
ncbi:MAG: FHA domain-containing protein [Phycisphaeraceae bacterium]|nr:FHA domain-containing protein [Phycisphaeraceae bacterium]